MSSTIDLSVDLPTTTVKYSSEYLEHFNADELRTTIAMLCGEHLGRGISRTVFEMRFNPEYVVKIEENNGQFQNIMEWKIWNKARQSFPTVLECLAPCVEISTCGRVLIMKRTKPVPKEMKDVTLPIWMSDISRRNIGMIDDKVVCHDYGLIVPVGPSFKRMTKYKLYY